MTAEELKSARKVKKLTQAGFADWLGVKPRTVIAWENRQNPIPENIARRIQESALKLNPSLPYEVFQEAEKKAAAAGMSLDEWVANLMREAVKQRENLQ